MSAEIKGAPNPFVDLLAGESFDIQVRVNGGYTIKVTSAKGVTAVCDIPLALCMLARTPERIKEIVTENIQEMINKLRSAENGGV